jgi:predicted  nucleic acid-binding Zn-ribbon protein
MTASILCPNCMTPGESSEYKGDGIVQCPDCEKILYRDFKA